MSAGTAPAAPRYAPDDPSLPKPWRGLVDGTTGYLYYWNPETNITQCDICSKGGANVIQRAGFSSPTPIQAQSWPIALQCQDVVAIAKTGSGKTLGYLLPGFMHIKRLQNNPRSGPTVLVLAPTRELATQILEEAVKFGRSSRISSTCLYGGAPKGPQLRDLDRGVDVVVATPGRLNDILEMRRISLKQVSYLVLDEADRMLDMGFEPQIRKIVKEIPPRRQTLMYTATWPKEVRRIAEDLLVHPVQVTIGSVDELVANSAITQNVELITPSEKLRRLEQILRSQDSGSKVLIFCTTKRMCDQLARTLTRQFGASAIHGDKSQSEREKVLSHFRSGRSPILVATDVAARGLDIKDIRVVINYDFPTGIEDYVHRIGRTGRAGATGVAYTFFCDQDSKYAADLIKILEGANQRVPRDLADMASRGGRGGRKRNRWATRSDRGGSRSELDSRYGGRDGLSGSSGRLDSSRSSRRHDYGDDGRSRRSGRGRSRSRSRSDSDRYSRSPKRSRRHSRSRTRSRSRSRSRSYTRNRRASHSRSRSPGASRRHERSATGSGSARPDSGHGERKRTPEADPSRNHTNHSDQKDDRHPEDGKVGKVDLDRSPTPQDKSGPYSPAYNGKTSRSVSPGNQVEGNNKAAEVSKNPDPSSPPQHGKTREDEEEGMIDEDGEIADDPRANATVQNGVLLNGGMKLRVHACLY
uniref:RNA helicase n=1 Tax=Oryza meridionalis TaxID=40149 RepID=A0A0E0C3F3_9ORYZ